MSFWADEHAWEAVMRSVRLLDTEKDVRGLSTPAGDFLKKIWTLNKELRREVLLLLWWKYRRMIKLMGLRAIARGVEMRTENVEGLCRRRFRFIYGSKADDSERIRTMLLGIEL